MALFKDAKRELQRLEAELLEEDALLEDDLEEETPEVSNRYKVYNADRTDWDPEELAQELDTPPRRGRRGLLVVALVIGLLLLLAWYYGGRL